MIFLWTHIVEIIVAMVVILLPIWIFSTRKHNKRPSVTNRTGESLDDGLLSEKRLKPMYNKLSKKVGQSFKWLKTEAKSKLGFPPRISRGDGLNSIFSDNILIDDFPMQSTDPDIEIENVRADILDENQRLAFSTLFKWGIFEGAELSILNELCSNAVLMSFKRGDAIFTFSDCDSRFLYIMKSGTCDVSFLMPDGSDEVVYDITAGSVIASVVDVISWIVRSDIKRHVIVKCTSDCEVIAIPSPRGEDGRFQSRLHTVSFSRIVRMLLIRFNRTTVTTALFYLGLAEHFLPSFPKVDISCRLSQLCSEMTSAAAASPSCEVDVDPAIYAEALSLVKTTIASLYGIPAEEVELPPIKCNAVGSIDSGAVEGKVPRMSRGKSDSLAESLTFQRKRSNTDVDEEEFLVVDRDDTSLRIPPPIAFTRANSFDQVDQPMGDGYNLTVGQSKQRKLKTGICLMRQGQSILDVDAVPGMYIIISGKVEIIFLGTNNLKRVSPQRSGHISAVSAGRKKHSASLLQGGEVIGQISILAGSSSEWYGRRDGTAPPVMSVLAVEDTWLLRVPMQCYEKAITRSPEVIFHLSTRIVGALPPLIRLFDFCTKWVRLKGGDDIVTRGQAPTGELYVVLCGRMRVLLHKHTDELTEQGGEYSWSYSAGGRSAADEEMGLYGRSNDWIIGRGTLIGDTQLLTGEPFRHTVRAIRRTALSKVPMKLLDFLSHRYPSILTYIVRNVSDKHMAQMSTSPHWGPSAGNIEAAGEMANFSKTMMVSPISGSVPLDLVCTTLKHCLEKCVHRVLLVTSSDAAVVFGGVLDGLSEYELILTVGSWMHQMDQEYDVVIYQSDWHNSAWNRLCVSQCDEMLLVANALDDPEVSIVEEYLHYESKLIPKTLVMLHTNPSPDLRPNGTRKWIESRKGVQRHVHVRMHANNRKYDMDHPRSDFNRLARILTDSAVGLVLGGGGARGISHLGILQALEERGIPVDMVGGTSIGSFIGGIVACEQSYDKVESVARAWADKAASFWFYLSDLTFPVTSYFNGYNFSRAIRKVFQRNKIEDFWLNYFCVTTDLTSHTERVHVNGTASRYIRASMSLANFLPPLCDVDPNDNTCHYLVDGGYVNSVPVDIMKYRFGAKIIIAVDVSGEWSLQANHNYGDFLSGVQVLLSKYSPFSKETQNVPSMSDIATQIAFVSACRQIQRVKGVADLYIVPPVNRYSTLDFGFFEEIKQIGLDYGRLSIDSWLQSLPPTKGGISKGNWLATAQASAARASARREEACATKIQGDVNGEERSDAKN